jgi:hypothetical protein
MPAILDDAFTSPFIQFKGLNPHGPLNLHGPLNQNAWETKDSQMKDAHVKFTPITPAYVTQAPEPVPVVAPAPLNMDHNCDRLIALMLSCQKCRERLAELLNDKSQTGGSVSDVAPSSLQWNTLTTTVIGNFLFGIAIIFIVDRLIRLRG